MPLSDLEAEKRITQMIAFIELEASERVKQINAQIEEIFNHEKAKICQTERLIVQKIYDKKEKQYKLDKRLEQVQLLNNARLNVLQYRDDRFRDVLNEVKHHINNIVKNSSLYRNLLKDLVLQGVEIMAEKVVILKVRQRDVKLIKSIDTEIRKKYKENTGDNIKINIDPEYLNAHCLGGILIYSTNKKIMVNNTLDERFKLIVTKYLPLIRTKLFGPNPHRRFFK